MRSTTLFIASLVFSTVIHVPLYACMSTFYFHGARGVAPARALSSPTLTYVPAPARPVTKQTNLPVRVSAPRITNSTYTVAPASVHAMSASVTKKRGTTKQDTLKTNKNVAPSALVPRVENIDLADRVVRESFLNYYELLSAIIKRFAVYPEEARAHREQGMSYVSFVLRKNGALGEVVVQHSSGSPSLDQAAVSAIQNATPFPPLPLELKKDEIRLFVPVSFEIE